MNEFNPWKWLEGGGAPVKGRLELAPLRRLKPVPKFIADVHVPTWGWTAKAGPLGVETVTVDRNASYIAAASSVVVAHSGLTHTGRIPFDPKLAGYWLVDFAATDEYGRRDRWNPRDQHGRPIDLVSPLGTGTVLTRSWLPHPLARLLVELAAEEPACFAEPRIVDSWTSDDTVRFKRWVNGHDGETGAREHRLALMDARDAGGEAEELAYKEGKDEYAMMIQMLLSGRGYSYHRPDWHHAIVTQALTTMWRDLWKAAKAGHGPIALGQVDDAVFLAEDYDALTMLDPAPLKMDLSGRALGTWKISR